MRIAIGSDHAGFDLKTILADELRALGDEVTDFGTDSTESCDYPDIALPLAEAVAAGNHEFGILICSNGVGPSIVANKVHGVRAAICHDTFSAKRAREHTDANVLCLGAWAIGRGAASEVLQAFRDAHFEGGRHERRLAKVKAIDDRTRASQRAGA
ncbi:MAG: ribose 5-phosphate isomerase B [Dehalococcoidia bacterium]|nr:MAG: ribose 5-phosphate isomerase B [Dehalococcoidia bacterium]